jgi:Rap1a immunity proteins
MAAAVVIGAPHSKQKGRRGPRFGMRTRRSVKDSLILAIIFSMASGHAMAMTSYELYAKCTANNNTIIGARDLLTCAMFVYGYVAGLDEAARLSGRSDLGIGSCPPNGVATGQFVLTFQRWAEQHPQWLTHPAADGLAAAFVNGFPCKKE